MSPCRFGSFINASVKARAAVRRKVEAAEKRLFGAKKCGECHRYETASDPPQPVAVLERWDSAAPVGVAISPTTLLIIPNYPTIVP